MVVTSQGLTISRVQPFCEEANASIQSISNREHMFILIKSIYFSFYHPLKIGIVVLIVHVRYIDYGYVRYIDIDIYHIRFL